MSQHHKVIVTSSISIPYSFVPKFNEVLCLKQVNLFPADWFFQQTVYSPGLTLLPSFEWSNFIEIPMNDFFKGYAVVCLIELFPQLNPILHMISPFPSSP